jgi:phage tail-like protein
VAPVPVPPAPSPPSLSTAPSRGPTQSLSAAMLQAGRANLSPTAPQAVYPAPAFYFKVVFGETSLKDETSFQEVSGISSEMDMEEVREGGENRFVQRLPKGVKHGPLELKRSIGTSNSALVRWCRSVMEGGLSEQILTAPLTVYLMNSESMPVRAWQFADTFPVKWDVEPFNSTKNEVAIEKITLNYSYSNRIV